MCSERLEARWGQHCAGHGRKIDRTSLRSDSRGMKGAKDIKMNRGRGQLVSISLKVSTARSIRRVWSLPRFRGDTRGYIGNSCALFSLVPNWPPFEPPSTKAFLSSAILVSSQPRRKNPGSLESQVWVRASANRWKLYADWHIVNSKKDRVL